MSDQAKLWHLKLCHAIIVKAVRRRVQDYLLPHVSCPAINYGDYARGKFRKRFPGSLKDESDVEGFHVDI